MSFLNRFIEGRPQDDTLGSVVRNLTRLFNSKRGFGSPLCEFGLGDYHEQQGQKGAVMAVMRSMLEDIASYEPRLRPLDLRVLNDGELPLALELCGELTMEVGGGRPLHPKVRIVTCRLGILFDPIHGEVYVQPIEEPRIHVR